MKRVIAMPHHKPKALQSEWVSEWVGFNIPPDTVYRSFRGRLFQAMHTHIIMKNKIKPKVIETNPKNRSKPKIVSTVDYERAHVTVMAVRIISPVMLQRVINCRTLFIEGRGGASQIDVVITWQLTQANI